MSDLCLTLLCSPAVEEKLFDLILMSPNATIFTSAPAATHGLPRGSFNQTERVLGRAFATQVQVILADADKAALLEQIQRHFAGAGLRYWVTPVVEAGEIA